MIGDVCGVCVFVQCVRKQDPIVPDIILTVIVARSAINQMV